ncbi:MAG: cytochrome C [Nitrosomonadales bacterium]|nr:cytochrome C [Nitrosomonadales bacterium]
MLRMLALASLMMALPMQAQANKLLMPGEVIKGHAKEEETCEKCHKKFDKGAQSQLCMDCHKPVGKDVKEKTGYHGLMEQGKECKECHTDHKGRGAKIAEFDHSKFDHQLTDYPLKGKHTDPKVKCEDCHKAEKKFSEAPRICNECHKKDDKHKGNFGAKCESCHVEKDWKEILFDHDKKTKYPLIGKHKEAKCSSCHKGDLFKDKLQMTCVSCHKKEDDKAHKGKFGGKCESCHVERDWKDILFDHDKKTKYPLLYKHKEAKCSGCHTGDLYKDKIKVKTCVSCHKKEDDKAHKGNFGAKCESCHIEKGWKEILFDHDKTKYPLLYKHKEVKCSSCHKGDLYKDKIKVMTCVSCHKKDDDKAHKGNFGAKCESCHVEKGWKDILFDHDKDTKYKLLGKHKEVKCVTCHKGDLYKDKLQSICFSCHEKDDKHKGQEGKKCESCHAEQSWTKTTFNHDKMSKFPLLGRHALVDCKKCHSAVTFKDAKSDCWSCHEKDDTHKRKLGTECKTCHNVRDWKTWDFNHDKTNFKLDGPHKNVGCYKCHQRPMNGKVVLSGTCGSCHDREDVHNGSFGDQCQRCHDGDKWSKVKMGSRR